MVGKTEYGSRTASKGVLLPMQPQAARTSGTGVDVDAVHRTYTDAIASAAPTEHNIEPQPNHLTDTNPLLHGHFWHTSLP